MYKTCIFLVYLICIFNTTVYGSPLTHPSMDSFVSTSNTSDILLNLHLSQLYLNADNDAKLQILDMQRELIRLNLNEEQLQEFKRKLDRIEIMALLRELNNEESHDFKSILIKLYL